MRQEKVINNERMGFDNLSMHRIGSKNKEKGGHNKFDLRKENCLGLFFSLSYLLSRSYIYHTTRPHLSFSLRMYVIVRIPPPFPTPLTPTSLHISRQTDSFRRWDDLVNQ